MKPFMLMSSILAASLIISAPTVVSAHVGHGDEFQATGGINRVKVNAQIKFAILTLQLTNFSKADFRLSRNCHPIHNIIFR